MMKKSTFIFVFLAAVALGFLCEWVPWQRGSIAINDHPIVPISCGLVLLLLAFSKFPEVKPVKPTLLILAISALASGLLVVIVDDKRFHIYAGHRVIMLLERIRLTIGGIFIGAAISSVFHGHLTSALLIATQRHELNAAQKKIDKAKHTSA